MNNSGELDIGFEFDKGEELDSFLPDTVSARMFVLEHMEEQYREWVHPCKIDERFLSGGRVGNHEESSAGSGLFDIQTSTDKAVDSKKKEDTSNKMENLAPKTEKLSVPIDADEPSSRGAE